MTVAALAGQALSGPVARRARGRDLPALTLCLGLGLSSIASTGGAEGGGVYVADGLLVLVLATLVLRRGWRPLGGRVGLTLALTGLWLAFAVLTDIVRQTPPQDYLRGWGKIVFFGLAVAAVRMLTVRNPGERLMAFLLGVTAAAAAKTALLPSDLQALDPWKFGFGAAAAMAAAWLGSRPGRGGRPLPAWLQVGAMIAVAAACLAFNARSLFAVTGAAAMLVALARVKAAVLGPRPIMRLPARLALAVAAIAALLLGQALYTAGAAHGLLGDAARAKAETQEVSGTLLLGGRSESFASLKAIADSPLLGHGSWARGRAYVAEQILRLRDLGRRDTDPLLAFDLIPTHSYLLGAWVEAGLGGAVAWLTMLVFTLRAFADAIDLRSRFLPLIAICAADLLWSIPFSPFGAGQRFLVAGELLVVFHAIDLWTAQASQAEAGR